MVKHTYINGKLEIESENEYVFLSVQPGRWNLIYFKPVGDANNHGVFMTDSAILAERLYKMVESSASGFFKMIKGDLSKTVIEKEIPIIPIENTVTTAVNYANLRWMELRNYAGQMNMPDYAKSKKKEILEWLGKNVG